MFKESHLQAFDQNDHCPVELVVTIFLATIFFIVSRQVAGGNVKRNKEFFMPSNRNDNQSLMTDPGIPQIIERYPRVSALIGSGRYPVTPEGRLLVEPTPREEIHTLYSVSANAPIRVWNGQAPQLVWFEILAFRKMLLMPFSEGLDESLHCEPLNEGQFATLFTANELPALEAFFLDLWQGTESVCVRAHPVPIQNSLPSNYGLSWGGNMRMYRAVQEVLFEFPSVELAMYFDANDYPPEEEPHEEKRPVTLRLVNSTGREGEAKDSSV
jgi:hypothetical protein